MKATASRHIPFKAIARLHRPVRSRHPHALEVLEWL